MSVPKKRFLKAIVAVLLITGFAAGIAPVEPHGRAAVDRKPAERHLACQGSNLSWSWQYNLPQGNHLQDIAAFNFKDLVSVGYDGTLWPRTTAG